MELYLPKTIGYRRLDPILRILWQLRVEASKLLRINWSRVEEIAPAGTAILACLYDVIAEQRARVEHVFVKRCLKSVPVVRNLMAMKSGMMRLPLPNIHDQYSEDCVLAGRQGGLDPLFSDRVEEVFGDILGEELAYSCRLILNELMQNSVDHSTSERYYLYAGTWPKRRNPLEVHVGVLDMGVTIPAKLEPKYAAPASDVEYIELALEKGTTTRRQRPGGLGLHYTFAHLKDSGGTLAILSRGGQIIRYLGHKKIIRRELRFRLGGTWCMARFPLRQEA